MITQFKTLNNFIETKNIPNLFFYGTSGTGKTTTVDKIINYLYKENKNEMVYKINGSEKTNSSIYKNDIRKFCDMECFLNDNGMKKMIVIDEADSLSIDSQQYIQSLMKKNHIKVFFCIICNFKDNIVSVIQSLCVSYNFKTLSKNTFVDILKNEYQDISDKNIFSDIYYISNKDIRRGKNIMNILMNNEISNIYNFFNFPSEENINIIYNILFSKMLLKNKYLQVKKILQDNLISLKYLIENFLNFIITKKSIYKTEYIEKLSDIEFYLSKDCNEDLQLMAFICIF